MTITKTGIKNFYTCRDCAVKWQSVWKFEHKERLLCRVCYERRIEKENKNVDTQN